MNETVAAMTLYQGKYRVESARLRGWDYRARGWYLITICTQNRARILGEVIEHDMKLSELGSIAASELGNLHTHYMNIQIDASVVMPNHVHAIVTIDGDHCFSPDPRPLMSTEIDGAPIPPPLAGSSSAIVRSYKAGVTRRARSLGWNRGLWQARFHDHILRGDAVIAAARDYIRNNPANWGQDQDNQS